MMAWSGPLHPPGGVDGRARPLELDYQPAIRRAVQETVEVGGRMPDAAAYRLGDPLQGLLQMDADALPGIAGQLVERPAENVALELQERRRVGARLDHDTVVLA